MKTIPLPLHPRRSGFTLVELLVVVAIIALLAGVALPSFGSIFKKMKREQARTLAIQIGNSIKNYYSEYSKYPLPPDYSGGEVAPLRTDEILTGTLMGTNLEMNPKKIKYLPDLKSVEPGGGFGLLTSGELITVVDPWGEEYYVYMDADYSGDIDNPDTTSTTTKLYQGVLVFSAGEDKDGSTWEDNIKTWDSGKKSSSQQNPPAQ
jgi:prepilin-type N-terminal cleavage/methylation domain-containing protein